MPEYDDVFIYGDFNQIIIAVKDERAKIFNGKIEPLEEEITYLVHKAQFGQAPVFVREQDDGNKQIVLYSKLGEETCTINIGTTELIKEDRFIGDFEFFIFSLDGNYAALDLFEPQKCIVVQGLNLKHLDSNLEYYTR